MKKMLLVFILFFGSFAFGESLVKKELAPFTHKGFLATSDVKKMRLESLMALKKMAPNITEQSSEEDKLIFLKTVIVVNHWAMLPEVLEYLGEWAFTPSTLLQKALKDMPPEIKKSWKDSVRIHREALSHGNG